MRGRRWLGAKAAGSTGCDARSSSLQRMVGHVVFTGDKVWRVIPTARLPELLNRLIVSSNLCQDCLFGDSDAVVLLNQVPVTRMRDHGVSEWDELDRGRLATGNVGSRVRIKLEVDLQTRN